MMDGHTNIDLWMM